jgi:hypothetical protein
MTTDQLEAFFYTWATTVLGGGIPVVWAHDDAQRPVTAYVELHLQNEQPVGGTSMRLPPDPLEGVIQLYETREIVLYTQGHGHTSRDMLSLLKKSLSRPSMIQIFTEAGIAYRRAEGIHDISTLRETHNWEERAALDLFCAFTENDTDTTGLLEAVKITGRFIGMQKVKIYA